MNAMLNIPNPSHPLPAILDTVPTSSLPRRRKSIGHYRLNSVDLDRFNRLLARLGRRQGPLAMDQVATAARQLAAPGGDKAPECIAQRIARLESVAAMVGDTAWEAANDAADCARLVLDYASDHEDLIPDWLPRIGRLDDAIVVEAAWPTLAREVASYRDFQRLRALEAHLRGCAPQELPFSREAWEATRRHEAALNAHRRRVRESSYAPVEAPCFRVH
ncbi:YkvA family protein [Pseudoxanthomonas putridarboris]|uniref:YkvA family protein n=1 Tax=Pseudoxanthomonas putridarboris TaxID=752605 RepID=A0ABU9IYS7_9GAMM